ncbi:sporulation protein YpjB [Paenibacillus sp. FJAT-26967]|uniref:sporulation protein YpjB n=1 Tax=Paenibacillus sp. FJAT-26967 TaxID=1729690 RepID=UPI000838630A|nr:sporulation protein YpjB [Paenibacillus sp. FJAT-26967]
MLFYSAKRIIGLCLWVAILTAAIGCSPVSREALPAATVSPSQIQAAESLNQAAEELYKLTEQGKTDEARIRLEQLGEQATKLTYDGAITIEGLHALTETISKAKRTFAATDFSQDEALFASAKIRLAADALTHRNQPMWLQYYKLVKDDLERLDSNIRAGKKLESLLDYSKLYRHYSTIRPAILINRSPADVNKMDSLLTFLKKGLAEDRLDKTALHTAMEHAHKTIDGLFGRSEREAFLPMPDTQDPIIWSIGIGTFIIGVLLFAGWRMFRLKPGYERVNHKKREGF